MTDAADELSASGKAVEADGDAAGEVGPSDGRLAVERGGRTGVDVPSGTAAVFGEGDAATAVTRGESADDGLHDDGDGDGDGFAGVEDRETGSGSSEWSSGTVRGEGEGRAMTDGSTTAIEFAAGDADDDRPPAAASGERGVDEDEAKGELSFLLAAAAADRFDATGPACRGPVSSTSVVAAGAEAAASAAFAAAACLASSALRWAMNDLAPIFLTGTTAGETGELSPLLGSTAPNAAAVVADAVGWAGCDGERAPLLLLLLLASALETSGYVSVSLMSSRFLVDGDKGPTKLVRARDERQSPFLQRELIEEGNAREHPFRPSPLVLIPQLPGRLPHALVSILRERLDKPFHLVGPSACPPMVDSKRCAGANGTPELRVGVLGRGGERDEERGERASAKDREKGVFGALYGGLGAQLAILAGRAPASSTLRRARSSSSDRRTSRTMLFVRRIRSSKGGM